MPADPLILWFRRDLRLADNAAVFEAADSGRPVLPVFILDADANWDDGAASRWWLHYSLEALAGSLRQLGGNLVLLSGSSAATLGKLVGESGATGIVTSRLAGAGGDPLLDDVDTALDGSAELEAFTGQLLHEPGTVMTGSGSPYKVFTPFWKACLELPDPGEPLPAPERMRFVKDAPDSETLDDWELTPAKPDWAGGLRDSWTPGEDGAHAMLEEFLDRAADYAGDRDRPDRRGTSRLSPHLHHGELSPRQVWHDVRRHCEPGTKGAEAFLRQLYWREFSYHLLHHFPDLPSEPLREEFSRFPWRRNAGSLKAWQHGQTGYPMVDAGMRELWHTGWMHNRVRMLVASLLVKHLLIPWQDGAEWFRDTLVDADEANNSAGWQWVAGCGTDAAPYFRIFNPVTQGRKFDPDGSYVRRWVPELAGLDNAYIHAPWEADAGALEKAGVKLGKDYPEPIIEHGRGRERALEAYECVKK